MGKTILCADDSVTMQLVAKITFKASDYGYVGARSADEALTKARADKPALILADAVMPGKTGYDLCKEVKSDQALAGVPVVLLCGNSQAFDDAKGQQVGPSKIVLIRRPTETDRAFFPHIGMFYRLYTVRFPRQLPSGQPLIAATTTRLVLRAAGALGSTELVWRVE